MLADCDESSSENERNGDKMGKVARTSEMRLSSPGIGLGIWKFPRDHSLAELYISFPSELAPSQGIRTFHPDLG